MDNRPIGVFDSGLGGLTGVRELRKRLPHEDIIYFGDTGRVPYGSRSPETILQYARQDVAFLLSKNVKCIMAACGTVSSTYPAAEAAQLPVPYLGVVDAAAREAAFVTRNRRIGVIGTAATIRSRSYEKLLRQLVPGVEITARACPLFVPLVEAGYVDHSEAGKQQITKLVIAQYLTEVREAGVDTLILGCTHYPLLRSMIRKVMGEGVNLPVVQGENVKILIGPENVADELKESSVIMASYDIGGGMQGVIGVVGPTRMDYADLAARLSYFAEGLSRMFGKGEIPPPAGSEPEE